MHITNVLRTHFNPIKNKYCLSIISNSPECFFIILQIPITMAMNESIEEKRAKKMRVERVFH